MGATASGEGVKARVGGTVVCLSRADQSRGCHRREEGHRAERCRCARKLQPPRPVHLWRENVSQRTGTLLGQRSVGEDACRVPDARDERQLSTPDIDSLARVALLHHNRCGGHLQLFPHGLRAACKAATA